MSIRFAYKSWIMASLALLLGGAAACQPPASPSAPAGSVVNLSPAEFHKRLKGEHAAILLDVRTPSEFAGGHLPGAQNLNFNSPTFQQQVAQLDRNKPVYLYCAVGGRSASAAAVMRKMGFQVLYNMSGGFSQWSAQGLPSQR